MKNRNSLMKINVQALTTAALFMCLSCSKKMVFSSSTTVPAAVGSVKIKTDNNKNYAIKVKVTHLATADKLSPPKNMYVVWMVTENNGTKNIGQLKSSGSLFSKTLKASLETVTSFNPTRFYVSAEDNGNVPFSSTLVVLTTQ